MINLKLLLYSRDKKDLMETQEMQENQGYWWEDACSFFLLYWHKMDIELKNG